MFYKNKNLPIHFSIDDVWRSLSDLFLYKPDSIFKVPLFKILKKWHEQYNFKVTLYVIAKTGNNSISDYDTSYRNEFRSNSSWLKFALHCVELSDDIRMCYDHYFRWHNILTSIVSDEAMSKIVRLHDFSCPASLISKLYDFNLRILLCADDNRPSYDLNDHECQLLAENGALSKNRIRYLKTSFRLEESIKYRYLIQKNRQAKLAAVFTHEYFFYGIRKCKGLLMTKWFLRSITKAGGLYYIGEEIETILQAEPSVLYH